MCSVHLIALPALIILKNIRVKLIYDSFNTADLCDEHSDLQIAEPIFMLYGNRFKFSGKIRTVKAIEDNSYVKKLLNERVKGDVMVIDGGDASLKCALLNLAKLAHKNGWSGF